MTRGKAKQLRALIEQLSATLDDETALTGIELFPAWRIEDYAVGDRVRHNDKLYRCVQAHTAQADWTPDLTPALWVAMSVDEYPQWIQPTGSHDAYKRGDIVKHNDKVWVLNADTSAYEPGTTHSGWVEKEAL